MQQSKKWQNPKAKFRQNYGQHSFAVALNIWWVCVFAVKVYETISEIAGHLRHCQVPNLDTWPHVYLERYTYLIGCRLQMITRQDTSK